MSEGIPWDRLTERGVIWAEGLEPVVDLRQRLRELGGSGQYNAPILIRLAGGRVAPTAASMLRQVAQEQGARVLKETLEALLAELCPEPWAVEGGRLAVEAARRRGLPVIALEKGQPASLVLPEGRVARMVVPRPEAFDLFDEPLDRGGFEAAEFVLVADSTPVREVVVALRGMHHPRQVYLLVETAGSLEVVDRRLPAEPTDWVVEVWSQRLAALRLRQYPARVRPYRALGQEQAKAIAQRGFLILTDEQGEVVGLMPPPRHRAQQVLPSREDFDLLDEPLPEAGLADLAGQQVDFIVVSYQTRLAQVALRLKDVDEPRDAFLLVVGAGGSPGLISAWELNRCLGQAGEEVWGRRLEEISPDLPAVEVRAYETAGRQQVGLLLRRYKYLLLTEDGAPNLLLAESREHKTYRDLGEGDLFSVPRQVLLAHLGPEPAALESLSTAGPKAGGLESYTPRSPAGAPTERFVNLWFADDAGWDVDRHRPLVQGQTYHLRLNIGRPLAASLTPETRPPIREPAPETAEGSQLYVGLFTDDFEVAEPTKPLWLPDRGDSKVVEFTLTPLRPAEGEDQATADVCIYYRCNLVQSWRVRAEVVRREAPARSAVPTLVALQEAVLLESRVEDYAGLEAVGPRHLSLVVDRAPGGGYRFDVVVAAGEEADRVHLACRIHLRREDLVHLITKARRQLYNVSRSRAYQQAVAVEPATQRKALRALALLGRQLYSRLFEVGGADSSARQVAAWLKENLAEGSTIQVLDRARDFVFPWNLIYDEVPWDEGGLLWDVDRRGFWGWRYKIELLTAELLDTYRAVGVEIDSKREVRIGAGVNDRLPWAQEQRALFEELAAQGQDRTAWHVFDSSPDLTRALQSGEDQILYLFCHGFTERMATDIQIDDDLLGEFRAWLRTLPAQERAALADQEETLFNVSDSWIKLTYGEVPLTMMEYYAAANLAEGPLVFMNMCESAQVLPSLSGGFVPFFIRRGARGVVGTECPMTATFAHPFATKCLRGLLEGQPVGDVFWALRREFLEQGNPLGLAYTLYCDANVRLADPVLQPAVEEERSEENGQVLGTSDR